MSIVKPLPHPPASAPLAPYSLDWTDATVKLCTFNQCSRGHRWPPKLQISNCPQCHTPVIAMLKEQCPICNEPVDKCVLRSDHTPRGAGVPPACTGQTGMSDCIEMVLVRDYPGKERACPCPPMPPATPQAGICQEQARAGMGRILTDTIIEPKEPTE